jgi:hypothetical protein
MRFKKLRFNNTDPSVRDVHNDSFETPFLETVFLKRLILKRL